MKGFYEVGPIRKVAINLFYGWGYNFYRLENQLRADDQLIRAKTGFLLGSARKSVEAAQSDYRREFLPPLTREKPQHHPKAVENAQTLERLSKAIGALVTLINNQPVPENDRMTQRYRNEATTLQALIQSDQLLVGQAELLRTMVDGAEHVGAGLAINENDSRVTRVGALLRRTSLDELPNLLNVVRGELSLIGPRPTIPVQVAQYTERQRGRLAIRPGITGWAQVNGRASLPWAERIELDLYYIEHRSLALDLRILWRTVAIVLGGSGLYKGQTGGWE